MRKQLLSVAFVCLCLGAWEVAQARDIQLRPDNPPVNDSSSNPAPQGTAATGVTDTSNMSTKQRLTRLERILNSQGLESMLMRMDNLQSQIEKLRGDLEVQAHQLEELKQRQRDLYVDIDRRLVRLERNSPGADVGAAVGGTGTSSKATPATASPSTTGKSTAAASASSGAGITSANSEGEQQAYQNAFNTLRDLRYEQAVKAFRAFLSKYPKGRYAHIAQYWIGEAEYAQRKYKQAIVEYQKLIDNYPNSPKLAEAMLKIGYSQYELKDYKAAEIILKQLIKSYPGTTEAGQAQNLLQKIRLKK